MVASFVKLQKTCIRSTFSTGVQWGGVLAKELLTADGYQRREHQFS